MLVLVHVPAHIPHNESERPWTGEHVPGSVSDMPTTRPLSGISKHNAVREDLSFEPPHLSNARYTFY
jgi:hypothetical protein